jgi:uncharacterized MnhB-related membrane protein
MELKEIRSAGDPELVKMNRNKRDPLIPCILAVLMQLIATVYLYSMGHPTDAVVSSGTLTAIYAFVSYLLNTKRSNGDNTEQ